MVCVLVVWRSLTGPVDWPTLVLIPLVVPLGISIAALTLTRGPVTIEAGVLHLNVPVKHPNRVKAKSLSLSELIDVVPETDEEGAGVRLHLADGTITFLPAVLFGKRRVEVMDGLCAPFGRTYLPELARFILNDGHIGEAWGAGSRGQDLGIDRRVQTFSGEMRKRFPVEFVRSLLAGENHGRKPLYIVTLVDGTQFLIKATPAVRRLMTDPSWSPKVRTDPSQV